MKSPQHDPPRAAVPAPHGSASPGRQLPWHRLGYGMQALALAIIFSVAGAVQTVVEATAGSPAQATARLVTAGVVLLACGLLLAWRGRTAYNYLSTVQASVLLLGGVLVATVLGTLVLQGMPGAKFAERYGMLAPVLRALMLDDVFHSYAFCTLLGLVGLASAVSVLRRRRSLLQWRNLGILGAHVSVLVLLFGALLGALAGTKGMIHLQVGESADRYEASHGGIAQGKANLGFSVRLDRFEIDRYQQEWNIYTYARDGEQFKVVASDRPRVGVQVGQPAPGSGTVVTVKRVLGNATLIAGVGKHLVQLPGGGEQIVQPGQTYPLHDGRVVAIDLAVPDFTYDTVTGKPVSRSSQPNNPVLVVRVAADAGQLKQAPVQYLFGREDMRNMMDQAGHGSGGLIYRFDAPTASASAWTEGPDSATNPAIELEVRRSGRPAESVMLMPHQETPLRLGDGRLLMYREKSDGIKNYQSTVTILRGGRPLLTQVIKVNDPLTFEGAALYQSNFDPDNPNYSGLQVVRDPGLLLVETGFWILLLGTLHAVALRHRRLPWQRKRPAATTDTAPDGAGELA